MPSNSGQGNGAPERFRVLVVDDSSAIRRRVVHKLQDRDFDIVEASSAEEALDITLEQSFDLVVSDIEMEAITGVQLCRVLRGDPGMTDIAFVLLTAAKGAHRHSIMARWSSLKPSGWSVTTLMPCTESSP